MTRWRGISLLEMLLVLWLLAVALAVSLPALARMRSAARTAAAARQVAMGFHALRWKSVSAANAHGWYFQRDSSGWFWLEVVDGNGNGLRSAEIASSTDGTLSGPQRLEQRVAGVHPGFPAGVAPPRIPPGSGALGGLDDPIKFGRSNLISFSPTGSSSSGTLYLTDGDTLFAVVLYGPTARIRVWRYEEASGRWRS